MMTIPDAGQLQGTPVVADGIMYVTAPNEAFALDAGSGRRIWHLKRPRTKGIAGGGANRGAAVAGERVFMVTDNAHLLALNRFTGDVLWETELADWRQNYAASSAPLPAGNLIVSGVSGGEHGANGFVAAFDQDTGKEVWRFWTVPKPGDAGIRNVAGEGHRSRRRPDLVHRQLRRRAGHRVLADRQSEPRNTTAAIDRATTCTRARFSRSIGRPGRSSGTTSSLRTTSGTGTPRRRRCSSTRTGRASARPLMLHASRNGFFYVFDRRDGKLLLAKPFVRNLTWASGIGADGRPDPAAEPGAVARRHQGLSIAGRRDQLVLAVVQPGDRALLRPDLREVQHLHDDASRGRGRAASRISAGRRRQRPIPSRSGS